MERATAYAFHLPFGTDCSLMAKVTDITRRRFDQRAQLKLPLKGAKKHPGRQELPAHLPRIEKIIACTPKQCVCGNCGKENSVIGYEMCEQLNVKPAEYFVVVTKREKRACKDCEDRE